MKTNLTNAIYGVIDYLAYPLGMLLISPIALRALGTGRYGVWMIAVSALSTGAIVASGFGDANIRWVAMQHAAGKTDKVLHAVRSAMGIHLALGSAMAALTWLLAPAATHHIVSSVPDLFQDCLWSLRTVGLLILLRAIESVCVSTQRALLRYGPALRIGMAARLLSLVTAAILPSVAHTVTSVLIATTVISALSVWLQIRQLGRLLDGSSVMPSFNREATRELMRIGSMTWIQSAAGLLFGQLDRLVVGVSLGAVAVSSYALCVQMAQPIYGVAAAALHFLFPRIAAEHALNDWGAVRRSVVLAISCNLSLIAVGTATLLAFGESILRAFGGEAMAHTGSVVLAPIVWSSALSGLAISGSYSMLALGRTATVTWLCLIGGAAMSLAIPYLLGRYGIYGMACSRLFFGPITLLVYLPLFRILGRRSERKMNRLPRPGALEEAR